jgi:aconitate hydratase
VSGLHDRAGGDEAGAATLLGNPEKTASTRNATDRIVTAGAIPAASDAGRSLIERSENPTDLNVFSSRHGN